MTAFLFKLLFAVAFFFVGRYFHRRVSTESEETSDDQRWLWPKLNLASRILSVVLLVWAFVGTSMVWITSGKIGTLKRIYFGNSLPPGRIVALDGELGPQARFLTAGFHWEAFITLTHSVDEVDVYTVPDGQCAILSAKDGAPINSGSAFAPQWSEVDRIKMANDAVYFLKEGKGQRGPQTTVLTPGSYTINPFLWEAPRLVPATRVEQGTVGVVKSSVRGPVDFGFFKREMPTSNELKVLVGGKLPKDAAGALLVPVGGIGIWEEPLPNGLYYINNEAFRVTMVPTIAQVYEYKGGYKRRIVDISTNDKGQITERISEVDVLTSEKSADSAIFIKPEGWDVAQELRVIAQVSPEMAPFVVASIGLTAANASQVIEDRVVTPIIRSIVRDVGGGAQISIRQQKAVLNDKGETVLNATGEPQTVLASEFRAMKVMDLLENRSSLEAAIEILAKPEALKEGVSILEVRLSESSIPAELLIARKREQLAQQLAKAWTQEEIAQTQRQKTENARAQAEQQSELVKADIEAQAAEKRAQARETEGKGEKTYLIAVAEGQKAQSEVLGQETTARLQMFQTALKALTGIIEKNPELLASGLNNAHKFVPSVVVTGGGNNGGGGMEGAAAIFGHLMGNKENVSPQKGNTTLQPAGQR
ncbi:MAG: hypothetical protein RLY57_498 [Candidatus Parcubacteria bacterium]|jgi:regulator of protease activity HflC (stomatin/prohibitin superfamily)